LKLIKLALALVISLAVIGLPCPSAQADNSTAEVNLTVNVIFPASVTTKHANKISFWGVTWGATLNGRLVDLGSFDSVNVSFEWGNTSGSLNRETRSYSMSKTGAFKAKVWWLLPNTTYYFRAKAEGDGNIFYGDELKFTTKKWPRWFW